MNKIMCFVKELFMLQQNENIPIGLCAFDKIKEKQIPKKREKQKKEMRLSELME